MQRRGNGNRRSRGRKGRGHQGGVVRARCKDRPPGGALRRRHGRGARAGHAPRHDGRGRCDPQPQAAAGRGGRAARQPAGQAAQDHQEEGGLRRERRGQALRALLPRRTGTGIRGAAQAGRASRGRQDNRPHAPQDQLRRPRLLGPRLRHDRGGGRAHAPHEAPRARDPGAGCRGRGRLQGARAGAARLALSQGRDRVQLGEPGRQEPQGREALRPAHVRPRRSRVHGHEPAAAQRASRAGQLLRAHDVPAAHHGHQDGPARRRRRGHARHPRRARDQAREPVRGRRAPLALAQEVRPLLRGRLLVHARGARARTTRVATHRTGASALATWPTTASRPARATTSPTTR